MYGQGNRIIVAIRKRPLNRKEQQKNYEDIVEAQSDQELYVNELRKKFDLTPFIQQHKFMFDAVFEDNINNLQLYKRLLKPIIYSIFEKKKVCCFAYG